MGLLRYSHESGAPARRVAFACRMAKLAERVKEERNQDLLRLVEDISRPKFEALVGQEVEILCEGPSKTNKERLSGRTSTNRIVIIEGNPERHIGEVFKVKIRETTGHTLYGDPVLSI